MTDKLTRLIEEAPYIHEGIFSSFMVVSNGIYDGFWGANGYDNILILAQPHKEDKWYILATEVDIFNIYDNIGKSSGFNLDIPTEYGVPRIWFDRPIRIDFSIRTSTIIGYMEDEKEACKNEYTENYDFNKQGETQ